MKQVSKKHLLCHYIILVLLLTAGIALDQWTKHLAVVHLKETHAGTVVVWKNLLQFTYVENRGAAWGMGEGMSMLFFVLGVIVIVVIAALYVQIPYRKRFWPMRICAGLFVCGAAGNMIDRVRQGYVVDFFEFGFMDFPVFNVADIYVTCAAIMIVLFGFFFYKEEDYEVFSLRRTKSKTDDREDSAK